MIVIVAGAHGKVAIHLLPLLLGDGHTVRGMVRREEDADIAIFAAGAGQHSTVERKSAVDLGAAVKLIDAAKRAGVSRFIMLSSIGAHDVTSLGERRIQYLRGKQAAD